MAIPVTADWKNAIQAQFRYPAYIKANLIVSPPGLRERVNINTSEKESITLADSIMDNSYEDIEPVASFEPNRWIGDGSMYLPSISNDKNLDIEWWSAGSASEVSITFNFDKNYTFPGMYFVWDTETNTWPTNVVLHGYNSEGDLIKSYTITNINSVRGYVDAPFENVKSIKMIIASWSVQNWRARITEILFGVQLKFSNDDISSATLNTSSSLISESLPVANLNFTINNYDKFFDPMLQQGYSKYLTERQRVEIKWGFSVDSETIQWLDPWIFYLNEWSIPTDELQVSIKASSRLDFLTTAYSKGVYTGGDITFKTFTETILRQSSIIRETRGETPWELDPVLSKLKTRAPAPYEAVNAILQLVANATGCVLDTNLQNNYIRMRSSCDSPDYTITKMQQMGDPSIEISSRLKSIQVGLRSFERRSAPEQVYKFEGKLYGTTTLEIDFNSKVIVSQPKFSIEGATILHITYYARSATAVVMAPEEGSDVLLLITGFIVDESTTFITTYYDDVLSTGLEVVVDNPPVTNMDTLNAVAKATESYYLKRKSMSLSYTGYPELEIGDKLKYETSYGNFEADTTKLSLEFNGGFSGSISSVIKESDEQ